MEQEHGRLATGRKPQESEALLLAGRQAFYGPARSLIGRGGFEQLFAVLLVRVLPNRRHRRLSSKRASRLCCRL